MAINLKSPAVATREQRLGTLIGWDGELSSLAQADARGCSSGCGGGQKLCEISGPFSQSSGCAEQTVQYEATQVRGAVLISHSPIGCSAGMASQNASYRYCQIKRGQQVEDVVALSTNLGERDMVYGGVEPLRAAIRLAAERHKPRVIFISTACSTGIIGDDVDSVARETQEEVGVPVVPVHCEGFRSKHWSTGFDAIQHAVLRHIVRKPTRRQADLINIFVLSGPNVYSPLLEQIGLRANLVLNGCEVENIEQLSEAAASTSFCYSLSSYLGAALEQEYGVIDLKSPPPYGFAGADIWLRDIGKVTGREAAVETLIEREHARVRPRIAELKAKLQGLRVFLGMGEGFAHGLIAVLGELGVNVVGALNFHHDIIYDGVDKQDITIAHLLKHYGDVKPFSVANGQPHRFAALLHQVKPDLVIVRHGVLNALSSRLGIPTMPLEGDSTLPFGYQGMINIGEELLSQLSQRRFHKSLAAHVRLPYRKEWLASQTQGEPLLERVA